MKSNGWKLSRPATDRLSTPMDTPLDTSMMARALQLARRGQYSAMPNPHVGCVLVRDGHVIGEGFTSPPVVTMRKLKPCALPAMPGRHRLCDAGAL